MKEIVKYHNDINKISFKGFNEKELNLFFSLVFLAKDKGTRELTIPFSELKNLSNDFDRNKQRFINNLNNVNKKLIALHHQVKIKDVIYTFSLFNIFGVDEGKNILTVEVNKIFAYMLNDLLANFTKFELENFIKIKSSYSKNMYKILKQWEGQKSQIKKKYFSLEELKELLNAPVGYDTFKFNQKIINQIKIDLKPFFFNLDITHQKKGRVITGYVFSWETKKKNININDLEIKISDTLDQAFEKASNNRYIKPFLTQENKVELIETFKDQKVLAKGLYFAYKTIDREFTKLSYLIKTITTGATQQTKTLKVDNKNKLKENESDIILSDNIIKNEDIKSEKVEIKKEKLVGKIEISEDEYNEKYQEYLNQYNTVDNPFTRRAFEMMYQVVKKEEDIVEDLFISPIKDAEKVYTAADIPEEQLLSKNGKKLTGGALARRITKILKEMNKE